MKITKMIILAVFMAIFSIPILLLNTQPEVISEIDNRMLAANPFDEEIRSREGAELSADVENYLKDRIGFRDQMILAYTVLNDRIFHRMDHPTYAYGKDGYVFFEYIPPVIFDEYHLAFAKMVQDVQNYCSDRNVPFIFVFNPEKKSVYTEFIADGVNFNNEWIHTFLQELDSRGINYIDNTQTLIEKKNEGEQVFNQKYNAGHWNDLGAFYGTNAVLENMKQFFPGVQLNNLDDFRIDQLLQESLPVSQFSIHEYEPIFSYNGSFDDLTLIYSSETKLNPKYPSYEYTVNKERKQAGSPKTLVFQGSYMNGMGYKFLESSLGEYIAVHNYQNILNLPYYYNLYQPECVIFEVAEYTFSSEFFDYETMKNLSWNPVLSEYAKGKVISDTQKLTADYIPVDKGNVFTTIRWCAETQYEHTWFYAGQEFDMTLVDSTQNIYEVTVPNNYISDNLESMYIIGAKDETMEPFLITDFNKP